MDINQYIKEYEDTKKEVKDVSKQNSELLQFLSVEGTDPDIERLIEAVSFLNYKLKKKLESQLPNVTQDLIRVLWPSILNQTPCTTILKMSSIKSSNSSLTIKRNTYVKAIENNKDYIFSTAFDTTLMLADVVNSKIRNNINFDCLSIDIKIYNNVFIEQLKKVPLRFYINEDDYTSAELYKHLFNDLEKVNIKVGDLSLGVNKRPEPIGFKECYDLIPANANTVRGIHLLQEYVQTPKKFMFFEIDLSEVEISDVDEKMTINFIFKREHEVLVNLTPKSFQLNCTPVINLFKSEARTLVDNGTLDKYKISSIHDHEYAYSVLSVAVREGDGAPEEYSEFEKFKHDSSDNQRYYQVWTLHKKSYKNQLYIALSHSKFRNRVMTIDLLCRNSEEVERLSIGSVSDYHDTTPNSIEFKNITGVTKASKAIYDPKYHMFLVNMMALSFESVTDVEIFKKIFILLLIPTIANETEKKTQRKKIDGVLEIKNKYRDFIEKGQVIRGSELKIKLESTAYAGNGDEYLFSKLISEFYKTFMPLNTVFMCEFSTTSGKKYIWTYKSNGEQLN